MELTTLTNDALRFEGNQEDFRAWVFEHPDTCEVLEILGLRPSDPGLFVTAITHTSFAHEFSHLAATHSERLEFLGDAFVGLYFSKRLFSLFPDLREGKLSQLRSALVNQDRLAQLACLTGLPRLLLMGRGEVARRAFASPALQGDVFEAVMGAFLLDRGEALAFEVLDRLLIAWRSKYGQEFINLELLEKFDAKSRLQELCVQLHGMAPRYQAVECSPGVFEVNISIAGRRLANLTRDSKKRAEKELAELVLRKELYVKDGG